MDLIEAKQNLSALLAALATLVSFVGPDGCRTASDALFHESVRAQEMVERQDGELMSLSPPRVVGSTAS